MKDFSSWVNVRRNESESSYGLSTKSFSSVNGESFFKEPQLSTSNEYICFRQHLKNLRKKNIGRLHINVNSIRNKFDQLVYGVKGKVDVLRIKETKLGESFPTVQFNIEGYYTFRSDRNEYRGGILLYVRDDNPSKFIPIKNSTIQVFFHRTEFQKKEIAFMLYL